jgi:c(7)-type cytochrome triheme protein
MRTERRLLLLASLALIAACAGCVREREVKDPADMDKSVGLETVPFYGVTTMEFKTKEALRSAEQDEVAKKVEVEKTMKEGGVAFWFNIPDPWVPPKKRGVLDVSAALRRMPKDVFGYPDWTAGVRAGMLKPRWTLKPEKEGEYRKDYLEFLESTGQKAVEPIEDVPFDLDIIFEINDRLMANVRFPHSVHSFWLSCKICHPAIFVPKKGGNDFTMYDIWAGKYCGRCHGKVAFQPKGFDNCRRCHSSKKKTMGVS